jgi:hypothetical protein
MAYSFLNQQKVNPGLWYLYINDNLGYPDPFSYPDSLSLEWILKMKKAKFDQDWSFGGKRKNG